MKINIIYIAICFLLSTTIKSQSLDILLKDAELLYNRTNTTILFPVDKKPSSNLWMPNFDMDKSRDITRLEIELKKWQAEEYQKDLGLVFKADANYNFDNVLDNETNSYTIGRARIELEWNILKTGWIHNKHKATILRNETIVLEQKQKRALKILWRRQFRIDCNYSINLETIELFNKFILFENQYFDFLNKLYFEKVIKRERLIEVSHQISILKNQLEILKKKNLVLKDSISKEFKNEKKLPFLSIEIDSLFFNKPDGNLICFEENIYLQHHPLNNLSLSVYTSQNYNYSLTANKFYPSIGIRFRAPIRFNHRKKIVDLKIKKTIAQNRNRFVGKQNEIITYLNSYNEKIKDLQNQYKSWQVLEERKRVLVTIKLELIGFETGAQLLVILEEQFKVLENTLQLKRHLYNDLSHLHELNESTSLEYFLHPLILEKHISHKNIVLTNSKLFSNKFQISFLKAKGINKVQITHEDKLLQNKLQQEDISFEIIQKHSSMTVEYLILTELETINNSYEKVYISKKQSNN